jgi:hypothetical protein
MCASQIMLFSLLVCYLFVALSVEAFGHLQQVSIYKHRGFSYSPLELLLMLLLSRLCVRIRVKLASFVIFVQYFLSDVLFVYPCSWCYVLLQMSLCAIARCLPTNLPSYMVFNY